MRNTQVCLAIILALTTGACGSSSPSGRDASPDVGTPDVDLADVPVGTADVQGSDALLLAEVAVPDAPVLAEGPAAQPGTGGVAGSSPTLAGTGGVVAASGGTTSGTGGSLGTGGAGIGGVAGSLGAGGSTANCGAHSVSMMRTSSEVLLLLDRSVSMLYSFEEQCFCSEDDALAASAATYSLCAATNCQSRWSVIAPALAEVVASGKGIDWGLKLFATEGVTQCAVSSLVEVALGPDHAAEIERHLESMTFSLSTPTAAAIRAGADYLKSVGAHGPKSMLLVTDGEPNCGGNPATILTTDVMGAAQAAKDAYDAGFPVYVIGIGPEVADLSRLAQAGGTSNYYPASSPNQLAEALRSTQAAVASCSYTLDATPPDVNQVGVYLDKQLVERDAANGWTFGVGNTDIVLNGASCEQITAGRASAVQALFACPGTSLPPVLP